MGVYKAIDIAQFVIEKYEESGVKITNLGLQKILFFIQWYFLKYHNKSCFEDKIEAWQYGPVVPSVYKECRSFGVNQFLISVFNVGNSRNITKNDRSEIEKVLEILKKYSAWDLVEMTHKEGGSWSKVNKYYEEIPIDLIKKDTTMELPK